MNTNGIIVFISFFIIELNFVAFNLSLVIAGCFHVQKTSETAQVYKCLYATNGGYFNVNNGACIGNLITDSKVIQVRSYGYSIHDNSMW